MKVTSELLNGINSKTTAGGIKTDSNVPVIKINQEVGKVSAQTNAAGLSMTAKAVSLTAVAAIVGLSIGSKVIDPNDFVNSCYGGGYWVEEYPWSETDAWVE